MLPVVSLYLGLLETEWSLAVLEPYGSEICVQSRLITGGRNKGRHPSHGLAAGLLEAFI